MTILALYNIKGGVGKTASAVNLSYLAAQDEKNTLICDLDPQSSTTYYFRVKPKVKAGIKPLVKGKRLERNIKGTDFEYLDLLPADFSFRNLDIAFDNMKRSQKRLQTILKPLSEQYEYIFLDCPPNLTLLSENVFHAADYIISPVIPTTLSYRTHARLLQFFKKENIDPNIVLPFFSMVERRKKMHRETMEQMAMEYTNMFTTPIPYLSDIERMGIYREPIFLYKPRSNSAKAYHNLWAEIKERIQG